MTMDWNSLLSTQRLRGSHEPATGDEGNEFLSDYYRVVFCSSFRRLQDKTQVCPLASTDFVRKRLTHSVEVAVVGERMGRVVARRLQERIGEGRRDDVGKVVAIAGLLHDIGNPPFGHEGELAIRAWADELKSCHGRSDYRCFDGNAQGFRIATRLQHHGKDFGLNLTSAVLSSTIKYPNLPPAIGEHDSVGLRQRGKHGYMRFEEPHYERVRINVGLEPGIRHPLVYLVEAADDIVNRLVDMEDALKLGLVGFDEIMDAIKGAGGDEATGLETVVNERISLLSAFPKESRDQLAYQHLRAIATGKMAKACEDVFVAQIEDIEGGTRLDDLVSLSAYAGVYKALDDLAKEKIFDNPEIVKTECGGKTAVQGLLDILHNAVFEDSKLAKMLPEVPTSPIDIEERTGELLKLQRVVDYVAGMTDRYAIRLFQELTGVSQ